MALESIGSALARPPHFAPRHAGNTAAYPVSAQYPFHLISTLTPKADIRGRHCDVRFVPKADMRTPRANAVVADRPRPPEHRQPIISGLRNEFSHGRAGVTESIRSIYADDGTQWQEIATPPQHGRIKAGGATTVQKQSVLASKLIPEKTRELAKRNF